MMDMEKKKNNIVKISGEVRSPFEHSHETHGENFYTFIVASQRTSGTYDSVPVTVSERLIDAAHDATGERIVVEGQFRSHNTHSETGNHLKLYVFENKKMMKITFSWMGIFAGSQYTEERPWDVRSLICYLRSIASMKNRITFRAFVGEEMLIFPPSLRLVSICRHGGGFRAGNM